MNDIVAADLRPASLANTADRPKTARTLQHMAMEFGMASYVKQARALQRRKDQQDVLRKIKVPTLVLCGAHDGLTPVKRHTFMAELIPGAQLQVLDNAGHLPTLEAPDAVTRALVDWLARSA